MIDLINPYQSLSNYNPASSSYCYVPASSSYCSPIQRGYYNIPIYSINYININNYNINNDIDAVDDKGNYNIKGIESKTRKKCWICGSDLNRQYDNKNSCYCATCGGYQPQIWEKNYEVLV